MAAVVVASLKVPASYLVLASFPASALDLALSLALLLALVLPQLVVAVSVLGSSHLSGLQVD